MKDLQSYKKMLPGIIKENATRYHIKQKYRSKFRYLEKILKRYWAPPY